MPPANAPHAAMADARWPDRDRRGAVSARAPLTCGHRVMQHRGGASRLATKLRLHFKLVKMLKSRSNASRHRAPPPLCSGNADGGGRRPGATSGRAGTLATSGTSTAARGVALGTLGRPRFLARCTSECTRAPAPRLNATIRAPNRGSPEVSGSIAHALSGQTQRRGRRLCMLRGPTRARHVEWLYWYQRARGGTPWR